MKVAIDIDNTLLRCKSLLYKIASKLEQKGSFKLSNTPIEISHDESKNFSNEKKHIIFGALGNIDKYEEIDGAVETINKLAESGHQIVFLSNRPNIRLLNNIVLTWLENKKVKYDFVIINCGNKVEFCKKHGVDLLIDDSVRNCVEAQKNGISTILFGKPENYNYVDLSDAKYDATKEDLKNANLNSNSTRYIKGISYKNTNKSYSAQTWKEVDKIIDKNFYTVNEKWA